MRAIWGLLLLVGLSVSGCGGNDSPLPVKLSAESEESVATLTQVVKQFPDALFIAVELTDGSYSSYHYGGDQYFCPRDGRTSYSSAVFPEEAFLISYMRSEQTTVKRFWVTFVAQANCLTMNNRLVDRNGFVRIERASRNSQPSQNLHGPELLP